MLRQLYLALDLPPLSMREFRWSLKLCWMSMKNRRFSMSARKESLLKSYRLSTLKQKSRCKSRLWRTLTYFALWFKSQLSRRTESNEWQPAEPSCKPKKTSAWGRPRTKSVLDLPRSSARGRPSWTKERNSSRKRRKRGTSSRLRTSSIATSKSSRLKRRRYKLRIIGCSRSPATSTTRSDSSRMKSWSISSKREDKKSRKTSMPKSKLLKLRCRKS